MTPEEFISKWSDTGLRERAAAQSHFIDLCRLLDEKPPTDADPKGEWYAFEKGAMKTGGGDGWADVWKRGCFAWEYKSPGKDLNAALKQLQYYVRCLENPPLLIVSDTEFLERLKNFRVLDPACGSGNFLYLALKELKNIEHRVNVECEQMGLPRGFPVVGPECVKGIEINPFAAELARVSVWIGEIQWMREHGFDASRNPILKPLKTIECRDALVNEDGTESTWPEADVIIGNPPFLGAKLMKSRMHDDRAKAIAATDAIRTVFADRLPGFTDLVCYWFEKGRAQIVAGKSERAGLVATKAIAKNTNLPVMRRIESDLLFFNAWQNEPWIQDGAAVRVAIACFSKSQ